MRTYMLSQLKTYFETKYKICKKSWDKEHSNHVRNFLQFVQLHDGRLIQFYKGPKDKGVVSVGSWNPSFEELFADDYYVVEE